MYKEMKMTIIVAVVALLMAMTLLFAASNMGYTVGGGFSAESAETLIATGRGYNYGSAGATLDPTDPTGGDCGSENCRFEDPHLDSATE